VIYLDSSVVLAALFAEARTPGLAFWRQALVSSRLLEYEVLNRVWARGLDPAKQLAVTRIISGVELTELVPEVLARALVPFPIPVKTLDGLHLATMDYLRANGQNFRLASYDKRLIAAANAIGVAIETGL
jgi:hypothetical protein